MISAFQNCSKFENLKIGHILAKWATLLPTKYQNCSAAPEKKYSFWIWYVHNFSKFDATLIFDIFNLYFTYT